MLYNPLRNIFTFRVGRPFQVKVGIGLVGAKFNMGPTRGGDKGEVGVQ